MNENTTILIVDDNHENLRVVSNYLKDKSYKLALALNGKEALKILEKISVDLILLDVMMPEMDGFETCKIIKSNLKTHDIPVVFLTAKNQTEDIVEGFEAGGVDYITKPFNHEELMVRVKNHVELASAKKQIIEMNKTRDKLYSIIAHDIKSPLNSIIFTLNMIKEGHFDTCHDDFRPVMGDLETTTKETKALIENLLDWAEFQNPEKGLAPAYNNLLQIASEVIMLLNTNAKQKDIVLKIQMSEKLTAWVDEVSMHTILRNLVNNAIKFTRPRGEVIITGKQGSNNLVEVSVKDNGIGMSEEVRKKLFEDGDHFTTMGTNKERGTGLGIVLIKDFVQKNNGKIKAETAPGKGTNITLWLPEKEN